VVLKGRKGQGARGSSAPERKCSLKEVQRLLATMMKGSSATSPQLLAPSDPNVVLLNDFPCANTELHRCACQIKCRDVACESAISLCLSLSLCSAIILTDGAVWATLKREANVEENHFLSLHNARTLPDARTRVASLAALRPTWGRTFNGPSRVIGDSFSSVGLSKVKALQNASQDTLCNGGPLMRRHNQALARQAARGAEAPSLASQRLGILAISMGTPASLAAALTRYAPLRRRRLPRRRRPPPPPPPLPPPSLVNKLTSKRNTFCIRPMKLE
jgi:hypothetical protein